MRCADETRPLGLPASDRKVSSPDSNQPVFFGFFNPVSEGPTYVVLSFLILALGITGFTLANEKWVKPAQPPEVMVDHNHDGYSRLTVLPGIGPSRAKAIVDFRRRHGSYHTPEDLIKVPGIGPGVVDRIRPYVTIESQDLKVNPGQTPGVPVEQIP